MKLLYFGPLSESVTIWPHGSYYIINAALANFLHFDQHFSWIIDF